MYLCTRIKRMREISYYNGIISPIIIDNKYTKKDKDMNETIISLDMLQSTGIGALALLLGMLMTRNIKWLQKFCIPSPVSGGLVFSIATLILYKVFHIELSFDGTLKDVFMLTSSPAWASSRTSRLSDKEERRSS